MKLLFFGIVINIDSSFSQIRQKKRGIAADVSTSAGVKIPTPRTKLFVQGKAVLLACF
jgi:hypothetical protein